VKRLFVAAALATLATGGEVVMANTFKILDAIQGTSFIAIEDAMRGSRRPALDVKHYRIEVVREQDGDTVILSPKDRARGSQDDVALRPASRLEQPARERPADTLDRNRIKVLDSVDGANLRAMEVAADVFRRRENVDLSQYRIEAIREGDSIIVIFMDKHQEQGARGSTGKPGFEVEMGARDLNVIRSNFVR
jgi:hypothetical protein